MVLKAWENKEMPCVVRFPLIIEIIWQFKYLLAVKFNGMKQLTACDIRGACGCSLWPGFSEE